jgi:hypothetical protein
VTYVYQPYPRAMYRMGEYKAVDSEEAEAVARDDGWADYYEDQRRMGTPKDGPEAAQGYTPDEAAPAKRRGRSPKNP